MIVPYGCFNLMINGRKYFLYRQDPKTEKVAVIESVDLIFSRIL